MTAKMAFLRFGSSTNLNGLWDERNGVISGKLTWAATPALPAITDCEIKAVRLKVAGR
jgi:hypothetical protein